MKSGVETGTQFVEMITRYEAAFHPFNPISDKEHILFSRILGERLEEVPEIHRDEIDWFATSEGKFFSRDVFYKAIEFLENNAKYTEEVFHANILENISYARSKLDFFTEQISHSDDLTYHDERLWIELRYAPTYLKLYEEVADNFFEPFILTLARSSRNRKDYTNQKVRAKINILGSHNFDLFIRNCNPTVRNAIGHDGIRFELFTVIFRDEKGNEERYSESEFISLERILKIS